MRLLIEHRDALGILAAPERVALVQRHMSQEPGEGLHLVLDVQYDGLPVWGAEVAAHFAADGALTSINAQKLGTLRPAMTLRYGPAAAQQRARPFHDRRLPVHVVLRVTHEVGRLRRAKAYAAVRLAMIALMSRSRPGVARLTLYAPMPRAILPSWLSSNVARMLSRNSVRAASQ